MRWFLLVAGFIVSTQNFSQSLLFASDEILKLTLKGDLSTLFSERYVENAKKPGNITVETEQPIQVSIKLSVRGNYRRDADNCEFPPLWIKIKRNASEIDRVKKIKLVTHCNNDPEFQQYLLKEYLAYKIYNELTDLSFKVRLCLITYKDEEKELFTRYAFLIEENKKLARRIGGKKVKDLVFSDKIPDYKNTGLISFFQLMIGNTDWYIPDHNIKIYALKKTKDTVNIPYDFDLAGLVNKPKAKPRSGLKIKKVTERYYLGHCKEEEELNTIVALFNNKKNTIFSLVQNFNELDETTRRMTLDYIKEFYSIINDPMKVRKKVMDSCDDYF